MKTIVIGMLLVGMGNTAIAAGQKPWPKQHNAVVQSSVVSSDVMFGYSYVLAAADSNQYPIHRFELDLRLAPKEHPLSRKDLTLVHTVGEHMSMLKNSPKSDVFSVAVPEGWELEYPGLWGVIELEQRYMIQPGKSLSGYIIRASEPPSIRDFVVGFYSWDFVNNPEDYEYPGRKLRRVGDPDELTTEVNKGIQYLGKTIAPVKPPEPFTISSWTARMTADALEARKLKWIKNDKNLLEIKKLIATLNTEDRSALAAAVKKIENYVLAEKKKGNLTDESDALVRINAQYLLHRLESTDVRK